ncbi:ubiquinone biosynthesis protein COQ9, mitochondrial [Neltuma alba]|uniref:ubiquinone biosynthesis protein COQ9, mitochondrial n=1 Tax=Neltuma alba TaxID=207710 RepID=UPI0010A48166|nr:ubiquinone biosynthesis protein COQ9, mitochondrial [Prosopis alba]
MYRTAAKRLFSRTTSLNYASDGFYFCSPTSFLRSHLFSTFQSEPSSDHRSNYQPRPQSLNFSSSSSSSSSSSDHAQRHETPTPTATYQDEHVRVLQASVPHVIKLGWTEAALIAGARDVGLSPSIIGSFPRKEAALVEFFMDDCLQRLVDRIDSDEGLKNLTPSDCIFKLVRIRLEMQAPYISSWPQALSIQAQPVNFPTSFKQRAMLIDEIWHAAGDTASDIDWYVKRTVLGGIYSTTEIYWLTDKSPDFRDTWAFLDARVNDAFDLKKSIQEAQYLAEAVGAGMGSSLQGFVRKVFKG